MPRNELSGKREVGRAAKPRARARRRAARHRRHRSRRSRGRTVGPPCPARGLLRQIAVEESRCPRRDCKRIRVAMRITAAGRGRFPLALRRRPVRSAAATLFARSGLADGRGQLRAADVDGADSGAGRPPDRRRCGYAHRPKRSTLRQAIVVETLLVRKVMFGTSPRAAVVLRPSHRYG